MSKVFSIRITDEQHADLLLRAEHDKRSVNYLIGQAIDGLLAGQEPKCQRCKAIREAK